MKKYVIEFLKRGMLFGGFGPLMAGVVYLIISIYTEFTLSPVEVFLAIISTYLLAFIQAGASIFNQMDMPILKTMALHFSFIYIAYVSCYLINNHPKILEYTSRYEDYVREDSQKKFWLQGKKWI